MPKRKAAATPMGRKKNRPTTSTNNSKNNNKSKVAQQRRNSTRIYVGKEDDRWQSVKTSKGMAKDEDLVKFLLDVYENCQCDAASSHSAFTFEPIAAAASRITHGTERSIPEDREDRDGDTIRDVGDNRSDIASEPVIVENEPLFASTPVTSGEAQVSVHGGPAGEYEMSVVNTPTLTAERQSEDDWTFELGPHGVNVMELPVDEGEEDIATPRLKGESILHRSHISTGRKVTDAKAMSEEECYIVYKQDLMDLVTQPPPTACKARKCKKPLQIKITRVATAAKLLWVCSDGHIAHTWFSQPKIMQMLAGNFLLAVNLVLSGNNYNKVALLLKFMRMGVVQKEVWRTIQRDFVVGPVSEYWARMQYKVLAECSGQAVVVSGDARCDSPGHTAQYSTYLLMDHKTKKILSAQVVDKREVSLKSSNMELLGMKRALAEVEDAGVKVTEIVTDQHPQITAYIKKETQLKHSFDIWHVGKGMRKRLTKLCKGKNGKELRPWVKDVINHFWYAARECDGNVSTFCGMWWSMIGHIVDKHVYHHPVTSELLQCKHAPLPPAEDRNHPDGDGKKYLIPGSTEHMAFIAFVNKSPYIKNAAYFVNFRHTSDLESINSLILAYCTKRIYFTPPVYLCRNLLAVIDYMEHMGREEKRRKDGTIQRSRKYSKGSRAWCMVKVMEPKQYTYVGSLQASIIEQKMTKAIQRGHVSMSMDDPRRICGHSAPVPPLSVAELAQRHQSRFGEPVLTSPTIDAADDHDDVSDGDDVDSDDDILSQDHLELSIMTQHSEVPHPTVPDPDESNDDADESSDDSLPSDFDHEDSESDDGQM